MGCIVDDSDEPSDEDDIAIMKKQMARRTGDAPPQSRASTVVEDSTEPAANNMDFDADDLYVNPATVKAGVPAARYANDGMDDSDGDTNRGWDREPTPSEIGTVAKGRTAERTRDVSSQSRSSTAVEEDVPAARYAGVGDDSDGGINQAAATIAQKQMTRKTGNVAHTPKAKAIEDDDEDDSPLTDVDQDASTGKKRKRHRKASAAVVRKSTRTRK